MVQGRIFGLTSLLFIAGVVANAAPAPEAIPGEFIVKVKSAKAFQTDAKTQSWLSNSLSVKAVLKSEGIFKVKRSMIETSDSVIAKLKQDANVEIAEPNYIYRANKTPNDAMFGNLWGMKNNGDKGGRPGIDIGATQAWDIETGSKDVIVAVIDTGIDYTHEDLKDNMWTNAAELNGKAGVDDDNNGYVDDIYGYNFAAPDSKSKEAGAGNGDPMDDFGHGSHCAGTIGAKGDNGVGVTGVNWNVRLMAVKFLDANGSGSLENALKAIDYATKMGATVESNSWGGGGASDTLKAAITRARDANVLFVAAAGNDGSNNDENPSYPASYDVDNVIAVAAIDNKGNTEFTHDDGSPWWGSNYGKTTVHIAAPGHLITSTVPHANAEISDASGYSTISGTSMATPHVSGVAALLKAHDKTMTYADLKKRILATAVPVAGLRSKTITGGVVNAYYALTNTTPPADPMDPFSWETKAAAASSAHPYENKVTKDYTIKIDGAKSLSVFFDRFDMERGYDFVQIKDGAGNVVAKMTGMHDKEFSPTVQGDTVVLTITADDNVNGYGFDVSKVAFK